MLGAIGWLIYQICSIVIFIVLAHVILSWLFYFNVLNRRNDFMTRIFTILGNIVDPMAKPLRRFLPKLGGIDLAPLVILLLAGFVQRLALSL